MKRFRVTLIRLCVCGFLMPLTSCLTPTGWQKPVDVIDYGVRGGAGSTGLHTVMKGDTVYTISERYRLPLRDVIAVNGLQPPYYLKQGYRLKLPPPNEYRVKTGDTLVGISRLFDVGVNQVARLNNLQSPYIVRRGQIIRIPSAENALQAEYKANAVAAPDVEPVMPAYKPGSVEAQVLPPPVSPQADTGAVQARVNTGRDAASFPPQPSPILAPDTLSPPTSKQVSAATPSIAPKIPARTGSGRFMRPVDGRVISAYGPKADGLHNDGINIKATRGTPVRGAENGVVVYAGNELQGYGNLVLVRHADRWMTAYAHLDKILVKKGDTIKAGQSIGTVGSTGQVDSPQLHFEVRRGTEALNPEPYL